VLEPLGLVVGSAFAGGVFVVEPCSAPGWAGYLGPYLAIGQAACSAVEEVFVERFPGQGAFDTVDWPLEWGSVDY